MQRAAGALARRVASHSPQLPPDACARRLAAFEEARGEPLEHLHAMVRELGGDYDVQLGE